MSASRRRRTTLAVILLLAAAVAVVVILHPHVSADSSAPGSSGSVGPTSAAAPTGPTGSAGAAAVTSSAPLTIDPEPTFVASDPPRTTSAGRAQVVLTYAGYQQSSHTVQANGFASGVIEDGGTCTLTLSRGSAVVTATSTAAADATTTSCGLLETSAGVAAGSWRAVLSYASATVHGTSGALTVVVP